MRLRCEGPANETNFLLYQGKKDHEQQVLFFTLFSSVLRNPSKYPNRTLLIYTKLHVGYNGEKSQPTDTVGKRESHQKSQCMDRVLHRGHFLPQVVSWIPGRVS